jgi:hypothetical protein
MRQLFSNHWISHADLLRKLGRDPKAYLRLAYWAGRPPGKPDHAPVFFITEDHEPRLEGDPRFLGWPDMAWERLPHPAAAEGVLTAHLDQDRGLLQVPIDVHWHIQF